MVAFSGANAVVTLLELIARISQDMIVVYVFVFDNIVCAYVYLLIVVGVILTIAGAALLFVIIVVVIPVVILCYKRRKRRRGRLSGRCTMLFVFILWKRTKNESN